VTDPGFAKAGWTMASAQREPIITEPTVVPAGRSPGGRHGGSSETEASCSFLYKRGKS